MPFPVEHLIEGQAKPVTVTLKDSALAALHLMIRYDYSQLPVIDEQGRPIGLVTSDTILRGLSNFQVTIECLHVKDVVCPAKMFSPEDDLFELLPNLRDVYAVLIVDNSRSLTGIVTDYDTSEFFRRRSEDIMLVEDIEKTLRDFVLAAFPNAQENSEEEEKSDPLLSEAINKIAFLPEERKRLKQAVIEYLKLEHSGFTFKPASLEAAYVKIEAQQKVKKFNDLAFSELEALIFSEDRWPAYGQAFTVGKEPTKHVLDDVREIRNKLAHFKGEVTELERSRLRSCMEWLQRHQDAVLEAFSKMKVPEAPNTSMISQSTPSSFANKMPREFLNGAEPGENDSKYAKLASHLQYLPLDENEVGMTFGEIENVIGQELPKFARQHRSWWANDSRGHVQSRQWLNAGWRVSYINLSDERVTFTRLAGRAGAYIDFFSKLMEKLGDFPKFQQDEDYPDGNYYHFVKSLPDIGVPACYLVATFKPQHKFSVELYIHCVNKAENKQFFDRLYLQKERIEQSFGEKLVWERSDNRDAAHIAYSIDGAITDPSEQLDELKNNVADILIRLLDAFREPITEIIKDQ